MGKVHEAIYAWRVGRMARQEELLSKSSWMDAAMRRRGITSTEDMSNEEFTLLIDEAWEYQSVYKGMALNWAGAVIVALLVGFVAAWWVKPVIPLDCEVAFPIPDGARCVVQVTEAGQ